jgi:hypothetical protein
MTETPRISVIMTVYNAEAYLREAVDGLIAQTFRDWELVAVENGSSDGSPAILASYVDPRIRIFALPNNIGRTPGLRYGVDRARGEYIAVLDADDIALQGRFAKQVAALDADPFIGLVGTWSDLIDERGNYLGSFRPKGGHESLIDQLGYANPFVHSAAMFRASIMRDVGGYPAEVVYAQDLALIVKIAAMARVGMIEEVLCRLREASTSMTAAPSLRLVRAEEELMLLQESARVLPLTVGARRLNNHRQAVARLKIGLALLRSPRAAKGLALLVGVLARNPLALVDNGVVRRRFKSARTKGTAS